jgi:hypothetical protein
VLGWECCLVHQHTRVAPVTRVTRSQGSAVVSSGRR